MFNDRRGGRDRRQQHLPMPSGLDRRRKNCRRSRHFQAQPWWLRIRYAEELVSESAYNQARADVPIGINSGQPVKTSGKSSSKNPTKK